MVSRRTFLGTTASMAVAAGAKGARAQAKTYRIGLSNGWVGSEWRTQMIEEARAAAAAWSHHGVTIETIVQSKTIDVQGQIADVRNFMNQGVDAIIVNPNSPTAFSPIFAQAKAKGVHVIATDGEVASKDAWFVGIDQQQWAELSAEWLAKQLGGKGKIVTINGIAGHPANQARVTGSKAVFAKYSDIEIVNEANGDWDAAKAQQVTQTLLATYPDLNGLWTQDGMAEGVWRAMEGAGKATLPATGELRASFVRQWQAKKWNTAASVNPPGCMANAVHAAAWLLQGKSVKADAAGGPNGNALYVPTKLIASENLNDALAQVDGKPDYAFVSLILSPDEIAQRFFA